MIAASARKKSRNSDFQSRVPVPLNGVLQVVRARIVARPDAGTCAKRAWCMAPLILLFLFADQPTKESVIDGSDRSLFMFGTMLMLQPRAFVGPGWVDLDGEEVTLIFPPADEDEHDEEAVDDEAS